MDIGIAFWVLAIKNIFFKNTFVQPSFGLVFVSLEKISGDTIIW